MAVLATTHPTMLDVTKRLSPNGQIDKIAELLEQSQPMLGVLPWIEGNLPTGMKHTIRTGLPTPTWRKLYGGVQPSKSTTSQVTDTCGMLEDFGEVDAKLADIANNKAEFLLSENVGHVQGIGIEFGDTFFYGNEKDEPEAFTGAAPRYNQISAANGENIVLPPNGISDLDVGAGNSSIWLFVLSPQTIFGIYPKGTQAGIQFENMGRVVLENAVDGNGGRMIIYRTHFGLDCGVAFRDWRFGVRIQFDVSDLAASPAASADLVDLMAQAEDLVPSLETGTPVWCMNRKTRSFLRRQIASKVSQSTLTTEKVAGRMVTMFDEIPVLRCDSILNTEDPVIA